MERRDHLAGLLPPVISVITITGIGDHLQPEWLITSPEWAAGRRNFMVPLPRFASWDDFKAWLEEQCRKRHADILRGYRGAGPCSVPCPIGGTGVDRSRTADDRAPDQGRQVPRGQKPGSFDFKAIPSLNKMQVLELARCEWIERRENVVALGPSGTGKAKVALGLGLAACQKGLAVGFITATALVHELMEARDKRRLLRLQKQLVNHKLLIIDELGFVPLSKTGAELLFELISQRYERSATLITSNLPFDEWTETFGSERLTGALLDRLTHHVSILEMNGDSYRLGQSRARKTQAAAEARP